MYMLQERIGRILKELSELRYGKKVPITRWEMLHTTDTEIDSAINKVEGWTDFFADSLWGGHNEYFVFRTRVTVPSELDGCTVLFRLRTGRENGWDATNPQFSLFVNGRRRQGLDVNHNDVLITQKANAGEEWEILLTAFTGVQNFRLELAACLQELRTDVERYYYDLLVPYQAAECMNESSGEYRMLIKAVNDSINCLDLRGHSEKEFSASLAKAEQIITTQLYETQCCEALPKIHCVGHTHIDVAWKWTLRVTRDKAIRSFSTAAELMERYPEYKFMSSQPQLYQYVKQYAPDLYERIRGYIAEGRWEPEGGMFVEADCNLSSGESLVRQFLYGKAFFQKEFGRDSEILWLPDVFGYSAALPQIMKKSGIRYFMTTKISWNETNKIPYDTFYWEGIDGTKILTHFSPAREACREDAMFMTSHFTTYNGHINSSYLKGTWNRYEPKSLNSEALLCFGYGDGGGGPTPEMLEQYRRLKTGVPGMPTAVMSTSREFFHTLEEHVKDDPKTPRWTGELYLEYHRGTYTSMARNKKMNRRAEFLIANEELLCTLAQNLLQQEYPMERIEAQWEILMRNQFHDILPGSSIEEVYEDSLLEYQTLFGAGKAILQNAMKALTEQIGAPKGALVVFNPNGTCAAGEICFESDVPVTALKVDSVCWPVQQTGAGCYIARVDAIPPKGYACLEPCEQSVASLPLHATTHSLENKWIRVELDECGRMSSIRDKREGREVLLPGEKGNVLMTYEDKPHRYDAWDINCYYTEKSWEIDEAQSIEVVENGPVRSVVRVIKQYGTSKVVQDITLYADSPEIFVKNEIDWNEKQVLLKALFPLDVHTSQARYEIQYGSVTRPTHRNTSWDQARFEVCMHKWLDLSEGGYGVSILNDCKYGCSVDGTRVGISLLKSAVDPNPKADKEHHSFTYVIYPHQGEWEETDTVKRAYALNNPLLVEKKKNEDGCLPASLCSCVLNCDNVQVEIIKKAQDSDDVIIRMYEYRNMRTQCSLMLAQKPAVVWECDLLEKNDRQLAVEDNRVLMQFAPYEIKTIRVKL